MSELSLRITFVDGYKKIRNCDFFSGFLIIFRFFYFSGLVIIFRICGNFQVYEYFQDLGLITKLSNVRFLVTTLKCYATVRLGCIVVLKQ